MLISQKKYNKIIAGSNEESIYDIADNIPMPPKPEKQSLVTRATQYIKNLLKL